MNLYNKLIEVRKHATYVQKNSSGFQFMYADEKDILALIRPKMDDLGIWLDIETGQPTATFQQEKVEKQGKGQPSVMRTVTMVEIPVIFTWVNADDPNDRIEKRIYLQGEAGNPQVLGGLLTYATRYFLYKNFLVATDVMDPDAFHNMTGRLTAKQVEELEREINGDVDLRKRILTWTEVDNLSDLPASKYETAIKGIKKLKEQQNGNV